MNMMYDADLPELAYAKSPSGEVVIVKAGQMGCNSLDFAVAPSIADEFVRRSNERLGVTPAQREALLFGSMFGFDKPGATIAAHEGRAK